MLGLCKNESVTGILEKSISNEGITTEILEKFNPEVAFGEKELVSMLFYLGYLTITSDQGGYANLSIPNRIMRELYSQYFLDVMAGDKDFEKSINYAEIWKKISTQGKIDILTGVAHKYLNNLSNRDYVKFDEKYIKLVFFCLAMNRRDYSVKSEPEVNRKYPDLLLVPRDREKNYQAVMIEFKYLKANEEDRLLEMKDVAKKQILEYSNFDDIKDINGLHKYTIVAVNDNLFVDEIF